LQGSLMGQDPLPPVTMLQQGHIQSMAEFWQALGGKLRSALNFTVTISVDVEKPIEIGPPVTEKQIDFALLTGTDQER
ncbi:MAG: DUF4255 domain-containing protein, partial [Anaerolineae bacterium]|nr:DUF4255 domain-containing protein [Anaerolineae bacterium]